MKNEWCQLKLKASGANPSEWIIVDDRGLALPCSQITIHVDANDSAYVMLKLHMKLIEVDIHSTGWKEGEK